MRKPLIRVSTLLATLVLAATASPAAGTAAAATSASVANAAGSIGPAAWSDCERVRALFCLWDNEWYQGRLVPNSKSGNFGSYQDSADSVRNRTGYYVMLYVHAYYNGAPCLLVYPLESVPDLKQVHPAFHDSISSVQYFQYWQDAVGSCDGAVYTA